MLDYTHQQYISLCSRLINASYDFHSVDEYLLNNSSIQKKNKKIIIIRHDVDRWIHNSVKMAQIEKKMGIKSTYYFRYPGTFSPSAIKLIFLYGHEIGYHYEVLSKTKGDIFLAWELFQKELAIFRTVAPVQTVSMHGSPLSPYNNRNLWDYYSLFDVGVIGEAYSLPGDILYLSDTGRSWNGKNNLRDHMSGKIYHTLKIRSTKDLIEFIDREKPSLLYLNIHPERWNNSPISYSVSFIMDTVFAAGKKMIKILRTTKHE